MIQRNHPGGGPEPPREPPPAPDPSPEESGLGFAQAIASAQEALAVLREDVTELRKAAVAVPQRATRVAKIKLLKGKAKLRGIAVLGAVGALGLLVGIFVLLAAVTMALVGTSYGVAALLGVPAWAGVGLTGLLMLIGMAVAGLIGWKSYAAASREKTKEALRDAGATPAGRPSSPPASAESPLPSHP